MTRNLLIGGAAGQGIDTTAAVVERLLQRAGYHVHTVRDFMSRIRGGHNFIQIRFGPERVTSHSDRLDGVIALDETTVREHMGQLTDDGFLVCDSAQDPEDSRAVRIGMTDIAKELGNPRVSGSVAVGALLRLLSLDRTHVREVLERQLPEKYLDINIAAVDKGYDLVDPRITLPDAPGGDRMLLSGNEAVALGAMAADLKFYTAYPMSPSTGIMVYLAARGDAAGILVEQAEDEIAAMNMAIGASFAGVRAMTGTSGGGFSLMVEALGLAGMAEIPLVVCDVQRPGPATGLPTRTEQSDLRFVISAAQGEFPRMVIALRDHEDAYLQTARAFRLAERYRIPVILLSDQYLADGSATVNPLPIRPEDAQREPTENQEFSVEDYLSYGDTPSGVTHRFYPGHPRHLVTADSDEHDENGHITESAEVRVRMMDKRMRKLASLRDELQEPDRIGPETADVLLLGWGSMKGPLTEAVTLLNEETERKVAALVFGDIFPLPEKTLRDMADRASLLVNVEQNATGQLAGLIREHTGLSCGQSVLKYDGRQMTGRYIADHVREVLS